MADFYYELNDGSVSKWGSKYYVVYSRMGDAMMAGGAGLTLHSDRVWCEQDGVVWFIKNRSGDPDKLTVDLKEFMWIKLKAQTVTTRITI